jgi:hypothetical protein
MFGFLTEYAFCKLAQQGTLRHAYCDYQEGSLGSPDSWRMRGSRASDRSEGMRPAALQLSTCKEKADPSVPSEDSTVKSRACMQHMWAGQRGTRADGTKARRVGAAAHVQAVQAGHALQRFVQGLVAAPQHLHKVQVSQLQALQRCQRGAVLEMAHPAHRGVHLCNRSQHVPMQMWDGEANGVTPEL